MGPCLLHGMPRPAAAPRLTCLWFCAEHSQPSAVAAERAWAVRAGTARPRPTWHQPSLPIWQVGSSSQASRPEGTPCLGAAPDPRRKGTQSVGAWCGLLSLSLLLVAGPGKEVAGPGGS